MANLSYASYAPFEFITIVIGFQASENRLWDSNRLVQFDAMAMFMWLPHPTSMGVD